MNQTPSDHPTTPEELIIYLKDARRKLKGSHAELALAILRLDNVLKSLDTTPRILS